MRFLVLCGLLVATPVSAVAQGTTHKYKATAGVQTFAVRPPVLTVKPGDRVETETFSREGDYYNPKGPGPWPGEVGPFAIEGAAPGDTLVVRILKLTPNRDVAISSVAPNGISGVAADNRTRMLNDPLPAKRYVWRIDRQRMMGILDLPASASKRIEIPLRPMLGRVAVAPAGEEAWGGLWPGDFGGNLDASDVAEGATVYLPVFHPGALFYFGDFHALQGDGGDRRLGARIDGRRHVSVRADQRPADPLAADRERRIHHGRRQRAAADRRAAHRLRRADRLAGR